MGLLDSLYITAHFIIFVAALVGALEISRAYLALIHLHWQTRASAKIFFVGCALVHLGLALGKSDALFFQIVSGIQAVSIVAFLILLAWDLNAALRNLRRAFQLIQDEYGADGDRMIATVTTALRKGK